MEKRYLINYKVKIYGINSNDFNKELDFFYVGEIENLDEIKRRIKNQLELDANTFYCGYILNSVFKVHECKIEIIITNIKSF